MFKLNGEQYSLEDLQKAAEKYNMEFDAYMEVMKTKGLEEIASIDSVDTSKKEDLQTAGATVGEMQVPDMDLTSEAGSLEFPGTEVEPEPLPSFESFIPESEYITTTRSGRRPTTLGIDEASKKYDEYYTNISPIALDLKNVSLDSAVEAYKEEYSDLGFEFHKKSRGIAITAPNGSEQTFVTSLGGGRQGYQGQNWSKAQEFIERNKGDQKAWESKKAAIRGIESIMSDIIEKEDYYDLDYGTLNLKQGKDVAILDSKDLFYNHPDLVQGIKNEAVKRYNRYNVEDREKTLFGDTAFQVADISDYRLDEITENVFAKAMAQDAAYKAEQTKEIILKEAKEKFEGDLNALADWATNAGAAEVQDPIEKRIANSWRNVYKLQNALDSENLTPEQQVGYNENLSKAAKEAAELTKKHLNPNNVILFNPSEGFTKTLKPGSSEEGGINIAPQVQEETTRLVALKNGSFKALQNRYVAHRIDLTDMRKNLSKELEVTRGDGSKYKATLSNLVNQHIMGTGKFIPGLSEDIEARGPKGDDLGTGAIQEVFGKREIEGIAKEYMRLKARDVAFKNMYLLNINPKSVERSGFWASAGEGFLESLSSGEVVDFYSGPNASDVLSEVKEVGDEAGIEWDTDQLNNFKETGKEFLGTTVGGLPVLASEFALANVVAGATLAVAGGDVFIAGLKAGKYYKAGRKAAMSTDEILSGAAADGYKGSILSKPVQKWVSMQPGIIKVGGGVVDRLTALTLEATIEGFKMQGVVGDSGFGMGAAFTPAAALVNTLAGRLGVRFKAKGAFHKLNDIVLKPLKGGIVMVPSAEGGAIIEAAIDDYIGGKDFNTYLDENFRDIEWLGEGGIYRRYLGHAVTGAALSYSHLPVKKILTKTLNGQMDLSAKAFEEINLINAQIEQELKLEGGKTRISRVLKPKLEKALEIYVAADNYISEAYALNEATDPQANARQASRDIEKTVKDFKKRTGKDLNLSLSIEMKGENLNGKAAEVTKREDGGWNITVDARKYHKGIFGHELGHVYGEIFGLNSPESLGKIVDFINKTVKKNTGEDLKALVEKSYEGKQAKELNSEEYLMAVIEILGKGGSGLVRNNVYGEIVQNLKGFYERRMKKGFDGKAPQLKIESPQELLNLLQRLSKGVGKDGSVKQFQQLSNLYLNNTKIFDGTTKEIKGTYGSENISEQIANIMLEQRRIASIPASERSAAQIQKLKDNVIKIKELKAEETEIIDVKKPAVKALNKKVIFLAGAAGSGKTTLIKNLGLPSKGFEIINQDPLLEKFSKEAGLPADMNKLTSEQKEDWRAAQEKAGKETRERLDKLREAGTGLVFDSTGAGKATMERDIREFKQAGYDVKLIFVDSPLEKSLERNRQRERVLTDTAVRNSYEAVLANKKRFKEVLGTDLIEINTSDAEAARKATSDISSKINEFIGEKKTIIDADTKFEKLAQLKKENIELAEKFGKEPIPGPAEKRLEKEIIEDLKDPINKLITNRTKALFDPIPEEARAGVTREKFQDSMRSDLVAMVLNEYKPGKQSIEKFLINRGYVRAFNLAERLGIKAAEKGIDKGIEAAEKVAAEPTSVEPAKEVKLIEPVERLIKDPELKNKFKKQVEEATKDFDPGEVNYKTLVDAAPELTRKVFGEVLKENGKVDKAKTKKLQQQFIRNNAEVIYALLPEGARKFAAGLKTATGIQASLLKNFYETGERAKMQTGTEAGLKTQTKKPFNKEAFLEVFGANKNQPQNRNQQTAIDALIKEVGKAMTNRAYRQALEAQEVSMNTIQKIADGKSINMASHGVAEKFGKVLLENPSEKNQAIAAQAISMISRNLPKFYPEVAFVMRNSAKKRNVTLESIVQENIMEAALWKNNYEKDGLNYVPASEIASNEVIIDKGKKTTRKQRYADSVVTLLEYFGDPEAASPSVRNAFYSAVGYNKMIKLGGPDGLRISQKNFNANNRTELLENAFNKGQKINFNKEKGFFEKNYPHAFFTVSGKGEVTKKYPFGNGFNGKLEQKTVELRKKYNNDTSNPKFRNELIEYIRNEQTHPDLRGTIDGFERTVESNIKLLTDTYANIADAYFSGKMSFEAASDLLRVQKDHTDGIFKALIPFESVSMGSIKKYARGKNKRNTFNEHMTELINYNLDFISLLKKEGITKEQVNESIKELVSGLKQAVIDVPTQKVKDSRRFGGPSKRNFADRALNTFLRSNSLNNDLIISGEHKGFTRAEALFDMLGVDGLQKALNRVPENRRLKQWGQINEALKSFETQKTKASEELSNQFNRIIEETTGIKAGEDISAVRAKMEAGAKGKYKLFVSASADDFVGLMNYNAGKGKQGEAHQKWFQENLYEPYARAYTEFNYDNVQMAKQFKDIKKLIKKNAPKFNLRKKIEGSKFTFEQALRAAIWDSQKMEVPGLNKADLKFLKEAVASNINLSVLKENLKRIAGGKYAKPGKDWYAGDISSDLRRGLNTTIRAKRLAAWKENVDLIFTPETMNKLEAAHGTPYRKALENMLDAMYTGKTRRAGKGSLEGRSLNYLNNSVGTIMFLNQRSATLQMLSAGNYINWSDNNPLKAASAVANIPQFAKDVKTLFNSDWAKSRREGLRINVTESEIADAVTGSNNTPKSIVSLLLKKGFLPTQIADAAATALGGASFYRNRIKTYEKQGLETKEAEAKAMQDWVEISETNQQSSRPDKISMQQRSDLGKIVLAFANTPMQYTRETKKAILDLKNGRGDAKTNLSKIAYYTFLQNAIFAGLQSAIFKMAWSDDEEDQKFLENKAPRIINSMADSFLRGMGYGGGIVSMLKNTGLKLAKEYKKGYKGDLESAAWELLKISPPVSSKVDKIRYSFKEIDRAGGFEKAIKEPIALDNPLVKSSSLLTEAVLNVPASRALTKIQNLTEVANSQREWYEKLALLSGWKAWEIDPEISKTKKQKSSKIDKQRRLQKRKMSR